MVFECIKLCFVDSEDTLHSQAAYKEHRWNTAKIGWASINGPNYKKKQVINVQ
jgi:hypothetical protein